MSAIVAAIQAIIAPFSPQRRVRQEGVVDGSESIEVEDRRVDEDTRSVNVGERGDAPGQIIAETEMNQAPVVTPGGKEAGGLISINVEGGRGSIPQTRILRTPILNGVRRKGRQRR